jgi:hypothetical protein
MKINVKLQFSYIQDDGDCVTIDSTVYDFIETTFEQTYSKPNPTTTIDAPNSYFPGIGPGVQEDPGGPPVNG